MPCDCCGTKKNVTYHPKINKSFCNRCESVMVTILSACQNKPQNLGQIKQAVKRYHGHVKEA